MYNIYLINVEYLFLSIYIYVEFIFILKNPKN